MADVTHSLRNLGMGTTRTTDCNADVIARQERLGDVARLFGKGGRKHEIDMVIIGIVVCCTNQPSYCSSPGPRTRSHTSPVHDLLEFIFPIALKNFVRLINNRVS